MADAPTLRPVNRNLVASRLMQRLFDSPLALHPNRAPMILAAIRSKYGLEQITMADEVWDGMAMDALAQEGRMAAAAADATRRNGRVFEEADDVAVIPIWGTLTQQWGLDPFSGMTGYDGITTKVIAAASDENIKGIWLDIDSGGGDVAGLKQCCDILRALSQREGGPKPIYAMANETAFSAAYALAVCADKVFVTPHGGVGSVGVITMHASRRRQMDAQGIDVTVIRAGQDKARANQFEDLPEHIRDRIKAHAETIRDWFVEHVSACMPGLSQKTVRETEGLDYMGDEARAIGFVSGVCSELDAWGKLQRRINR